MLIDRIKLFESGFRAIKDSIEKLLQQSDSKAVLLVDRDGNLITSAGETEKIDLESFATLSAADFAATSHLAEIIGERQFQTLYHQGERDHLYFHAIASNIIIAVIFDQRTTLGLVRVRVKHASENLTKILEDIFGRQQEERGEEEAEIEDISKDIEDELDRLFG
ncbi:roadblock/LC7 domain-containing protein [candidate division WOR-3 bacterium]|uniref:Roadblock/LC7 domain-containing protein n=1 Tax=candidate division WOR-3 bacterium TaxID=2052148 RepID=A0A9D5KA81_UNCW3|nr:roadblock/LC7 domain-containing protein [candidate division WOR-3 bacterium]MBD3365251.1 roadblock/LC7 domain-containing protein [candidate division WOR-3 bacterium]